MNLEAYLKDDLNQYQAMVNADLIRLIVSEFDTWLANLNFSAAVMAELQFNHQLLNFLIFKINTELKTIEKFKDDYNEFNKFYTKAITKYERQQHILNYSLKLGYTARELKKDQKAFERWFGADAVYERYLKRNGEAERRLVFYLKRLSKITIHLLNMEKDEISELWKMLALEELLKPILYYKGDSRVNTAAFETLTDVLNAMPGKNHEKLLDQSTTQFIYRSAIDSRRPVWIQCDALELLQTLSLDSLEIVLKRRLENPESGDDIFVRHRMILVMGKVFADKPELLDLIPVICQDPSPYVRQAIAEAISQTPFDHLKTGLENLILHDESPQVRAKSLLECHRIFLNINHPEIISIQTFLGDLLIRVFEQEKDSFVLKIGLKVIEQLFSSNDSLNEEISAALLMKILPALEVLHISATSTAVRRWTAQTINFVWSEITPEAKILKELIMGKVKAIAPGKTISIKDDEIVNQPEEILGRTLSVICQNDFGLDIRLLKNKLKITRGDVFVTRLWRLWHELQNPSPDKRQAFDHTTGRKYEGNIRVPSEILAELAVTKVPGEPLFLSSEAGWRAFVPLLDDVISQLKVFSRGKPVKFYTSEGVTEYKPPKTFLGRMKAFFYLSYHFSQIARLRNWVESSQMNPNTYLKKLQHQGCLLTYQPYKNYEGHHKNADPNVVRFFPALVPLPELWQRVQDYFISLYENSLQDLAIFTLLIIILFLGRHLFLNYRHYRHRKNFPLVVGGWGTRGKSSVERLKAALFNSLGFGLVSKTTGCEAMFLFAHPFGQMVEMFLFRPYDKATIWEQTFVAKIASLLKTDVMLWECMALRPDYVQLLQQNWMHDQISTITNTYPDHEDIMGPAGINIPVVMNGFIPLNATLLTTEEQMLPILVEGAKAHNTKLKSAGWIEAGLIAPDIFKRFPYEEHPYNLALLLALAKEMGIDADFAMKEMADRVIPDIGNLKIYPAAKIKTRRLEFVNGMSANERLGCLSNWIRLSFDKQDYQTEPHVWITTVVNNRADRIPRSKVFADVIVADISADRFFLIGSNLNGLQGYIRESWENYISQISIWQDKGQSATQNAVAVVENLARHFRLPYRMEIVTDKLRIMLNAVLATVTHPEDCELQTNTLMQLWDSPEKLIIELKTKQIASDLIDSVIEQHRFELQIFKEITGLVHKIRQSKSEDSEDLELEFRRCFSNWFWQKIIVVDDFFAPGDKIVSIITEATPPGFYNRVMGIQNIKGTGLDFVYRWQAWDNCYQNCALTLSQNIIEVTKGFRALSSFQDYGLLCEEYVRETMAAVQSRSITQTEELQAAMQIILSNLDNVMNVVRSKVEKRIVKKGRFTKIIAFLEGMLDMFDAMFRKKIANQVYMDLVNERISSERAAMVLKELNKRQKGGWLISRISEGLQFFR